MLRIPSTRNWAIVGEIRPFFLNSCGTHSNISIGREIIEPERGKELANEVLETVKERGIFKTRTPEGKSH